jgi:hypothetical protein
MRNIRNISKSTTQKLNDRHSSKENIQIDNYVKKSSPSFIIREVHIKIKIRYHFTPVKLDIMKKAKTAGKDMEEVNPISENVN